MLYFISTLRFGARFGLLGLAAIVLLSSTMLAQTTISTGSIVGTVTDPSGAVVGGAKVLITNKGTNQAISSTTNSSGTYASGALIPGEYVVRVEGAGFTTAEISVIVQVNTTASANVKLAVGQSSQVVEVQASEVAVNTEQATVQGVLTCRSKSRTCPSMAATFSIMAQMEPGVQIQSWRHFPDSYEERFLFRLNLAAGSAAPALLSRSDGIDISDENCGHHDSKCSKWSDPRNSRCSEVLARPLDRVDFIGSREHNRKSSANGVHGEGFYYFRDQSLNA